MDALKSAGKAILRSPSIARHTRRVTRHQKLPESWTDSQESLLEGVIFHLKYLGMTLVETPKGEEMAAAAIRRIITMTRAGANKLQKVVLTVTPRGIALQDAASGNQIENVSIYRISYCTTDKVQNKVFAYVAQNQSNGALECHAFLSPKKKLAQTVTMTVAQAFTMALELWQSAREGKEDSSQGFLQAAEVRPDHSAQIPDAFTLDGDQPVPADVCSGSLKTFPHREDEEEEDGFGDLDEDFSRLADAGTEQPGYPEAVT
ncbi:low density lipoprotein receptor adapter protein 1-A-like isoform X2 [Pseudophryne corroboree]|uniref:low density lipoprotein receptor adapter protein 1-A-like isoform X2 n=1 Tax=Pseudophryne corroboree TaxID=495146 RepID=UPI0030820083